MEDYELIAKELSDVGEKIRELQARVAEVERVNARLEDAALSTARALSEVSRHWDAVYEAMRREEVTEPMSPSERDTAAEALRDRRAGPEERGVECLYWPCSQSLGRNP